jgi:glycosyltransferase involved in cell wall biosynthesis
MSAEQPIEGPVPELSVIVCSRNGARQLPTVLSSLARQTLSADRFETIVVDDGSDDQTSDTAARAGARTFRLERNAGLAAARNAGLAFSRGPLVAFTDDDCEVDSRWCEVILDAFRDPSVQGISGPVLPEADDPALRRFLRANNPLRPLGSELLQSTALAHRLRLYCRDLLGATPAPSTLYSVVGANMAFRRRMLLQLGGFDEEFRFGSEEEELCIRAHRLRPPARLVYEPRLLVTHWFRPGFADCLRRSRSYGRGNARRFLKHRDTRLVVFPIPLLACGLLFGGALTRRAVLTMCGALLPLAGYPLWLRELWRTRRMDTVLHPYIRLWQEIYNMLGELDGLRAGYEPRPARLLAPALLGTDERGVALVGAGGDRSGAEVPGVPC